MELKKTLDPRDTKLAVGRELTNSNLHRALGRVSADTRRMNPDLESVEIEQFSSSFLARNQHFRKRPTSLL
jgi:hypothetical protein